MTWAVTVALLAFAQAATPSNDQARAVVQAVGEALVTGYIYEDVGTRAARALEKKSAEGAFDGLGLVKSPRCGVTSIAARAKS